MAQSYEKAGVNLEAGYEVVRRIKKHVASTSRLGVMGNIGAFGGMFDLSALKVKEPVLVSGTDGVGTKLKLAFEMDKHDTIGIDAVAMCVNDVLAQGAEPLVFLDYVAVGRNEPQKIEAIVAGVADGCRQAGCALVGGETAEMPGMYAQGEYDIAGFTVGVVEKSKLIDGSKVKAGDVISAGQEVAGVRDDSTLLLTLDFPAADAITYFVGQSVDVIIDGTFETTTGTIQSISGADSLSSGNLAVRSVVIAVSNPGPLNTTMSGTASINGVSAMSSAHFTCQYEQIITAAASGTVAALCVREVSTVGVDTALVQLSSSSLTKQVKSASNSLRSAEISLDDTQRSMEDYMPPPSRRSTPKITTSSAGTTASAAQQAARSACSSP